MRRVASLPSHDRWRPGGSPETAPTPHEVQAEALAALRATRAKGYGAGLVVLATGLGKTFLAAFDSADAARVLFVAHREEILTQAMAAFRAVRPRGRLGRYGGEEKDAAADIVFASVQTLARHAHLTRFDRGPSITSSSTSSTTRPPQPIGGSSIISSPASCWA